MPKLDNNQHEIFCLEYLVDLNGRKAAERAGFKRTSAKQRASKLRALPEVAARIKELMEERSERTKVMQDRVVLELARVSFADMQDFASWGPSGIKLKSSRSLGEDDTAAVQEVSESATGKYSIKLHNKIAALEKLGKHLGMFTERHEVEHKGSIRFLAPTVVKSGESSSSSEESDDGVTDD